MTATEQIEAGPETDRLVADAVGLVYVEEFDSAGPVEVYFHDGRRSFRPSLDWSDAMLAAERFGLFHPEKHDAMLMQDFSGRNILWSIQQVPRSSGWMAVAEAPTGPLAICRAILALREGVIARRCREMRDEVDREFSKRAFGEERA